MHDAFEYASILERLPLVIESIASYGKICFVHLVISCIYEVRYNGLVWVFIFALISLHFEKKIRIKIVDNATL